jgi:hypothetical protein
VGTYRAKEAKQASRCSSLISCGILRSTEVAAVWLLKLLAELNHRRWFSATDINTDLGGAGACQLAARLRQGSGCSSVVRRENGYYIETVRHGIVYRWWSMSEIAIFRQLSRKSATAD